MEAHPIYDKWAPIINMHKNTPGTEIEIRFGRAGRGGFDTNVGQQTFKKVLGALERYTEWETKKHTKSTVYYFEEPGTESRPDRRSYKRLTVDDETDEQVGHIKKRVKVDDFVLDGKPLDVRLGVSTEEPFEYDGEETSTEQKAKERWSFVRKNLSIDLSIIKGIQTTRIQTRTRLTKLNWKLSNPNWSTTRTRCITYFTKSSTSSSASSSWPPC